MLPIIIILAVVVALSFLVDTWLKYRNSPKTKAKKKERQQTAQHKDPPSTKTVQGYIK